MIRDISASQDNPIPCGIFENEIKQEVDPFLNSYEHQYNESHDLIVNKSYDEPTIKIESSIEDIFQVTQTTERATNDNFVECTQMQPAGRRKTQKIASKSSSKNNKKKYSTKGISTQTTSIGESKRMRPCELRPSGECYCDICGKSAKNYDSIRKHMHTFHILPIRSQQASYFTDLLEPICELRTIPTTETASNANIAKFTRLKPTIRRKSPGIASKSKKIKKKKKKKYSTKAISTQQNSTHESKRMRPCELRPSGEIYCDICGTSAKNFESIRKHMRTYHILPKMAQRKRAQPTDAYDYSAVLLAELRTAGPYECDICHTIVTSFDGLKVHIMRHLFPDENKLECDVCKKTFFSRGSLTAHKRTHTGELPYMCHICAKSFNHPSHLK